MPRLNLEQGSDEWHSYRQCHIMATSASSIMGINPFKSEMVLWQQMLGLKKPDKLNAKMKRGSKLEPEARNLACSMISKEFVPCVFENDDINWQAASLDGISNCGNYILEIKCPGEDTHILALNSIIPDYYICQIQHQLCVTKAEKAYYFSYRPEYEKKVAIIQVYPDAEYIEKLIKKEMEFWINVCTLQPPEYIWNFEVERAKCISF
jgi:putative phage-type endonuclease